MSIKNYVIGDLHGNFKPIRDFYLRNKDNKDFYNSEKYMICLGDSGLNYYLDSRDKEFKEKLSDFPFTYFIVRGNHEERASIISKKNPDEWKIETFWGAPVFVEKIFPNIKYAMDIPEVYDIPYTLKEVQEKDSSMENLNTYRTFVIPGAYSVDKHYRLAMGYNWFENEQLTEEEKDSGLCDLELMDYKCDVVLSHTCPCIFEPTDLFLPMVDQSTVDKSMERYLGLIEIGLDYKLWCFGHYHSTRVYPLQNGTSQPLMLYNDKIIDLDEWMAAISNKSIGRFL